MKIVSGGQTGVDRAALDAALEHEVECGGWCPEGRLDERGIIPRHYPLTELPDGGFAERTDANVRDSDATIIFHCGAVAGGTEHTLECCSRRRRPRLLLDARIVSPAEAAKMIEHFVQHLGITTLNVAGPRETEWPDGYDYAFRVLTRFLEKTK